LQSESVQSFSVAAAQAAGGGAAGIKH